MEWNRGIIRLRDDTAPGSRDQLIAALLSPTGSCLVSYLSGSRYKHGRG